MGERGQRGAQTAETSTVPLELVTKDRRLSSSGKRVLMRSMLGQRSHLATGEVLSHCLSIETSGWVAGEGVLVWADYSGKITSNVSFTLTSPQGNGEILLLLILRHVYLCPSRNDMFFLGIIQKIHTRTHPHHITAHPHTHTHTHR